MAEVETGVVPKTKAGVMAEAEARVVLESKPWMVAAEARVVLESKARMVAAEIMLGLGGGRREQHRSCYG
ncbi:MAG: hypothetical protein M3Q08_12815 [Pseudomonadota bacterium]|nr:hypothetical protein [Pseudomonadota bacterium]